MIIPRLGWGQHADVLLACDFEKIIYGHLDDCSVFFQNREPGFYSTRILAAYTTKMYLCAPDELGIFQCITEWGNYP